MKWLIVLVAIITPRLAEAHCHDVSHVVGYQHCTRFGAWSHGYPLWWELGAVALRFDPKPIDAMSKTITNGEATTYHVVGAPGDDRPVTAAGLRLRHTLGLSHRLYLGSEFDWASVTSGPHLVADVVTRGTGSTMLASTGGWVAENKLLIGTHASLGFVTLAAELGPGVRIAVFSTDAVPASARPPTQGWFIVAAQVAAHAWLTPNITLGITAGTDLLRANEVSVGATIGFHLTPFDLTR